MKSDPLFCLRTRIFIGLKFHALFAERPDLIDLWEEYAASTSPESRFVHEVDKLDMALQALRYSQIQGADTREFLRSARKRITHPTLSALLDQIEDAVAR